MATSTSSSDATIARNNRRRINPAFLIAGFLVIAVAIVLIRRWVHHAQAELFPVIVSQDAVAEQIVAPPVSAILQRMARDMRDVIAPPQRPRYAVLSFDDGPYPVTTPVLLAELQRLHVPANFFLIGRDATDQPAIAARLAAPANEVGNHTLDHPEMNGLPYQTQFDEVDAGARAIERVTGQPSNYFRPPHGNFDANTLQAARADHETVVFWDIDPGDWKQVTPQFILDNVTSHAKSPAVILLHNGSTATIEALPELVARYRRAGFEFVTISELQRRLSLDQINDPINVQMR